MRRDFFGMNDGPTCSRAVNDQHFLFDLIRQSSSRKASCLIPLSKTVAVCRDTRRHTSRLFKGEAKGAEMSAANLG